MFKTLEEEGVGALLLFSENYQTQSVFDAVLYITVVALSFRIQCTCSVRALLTQLTVKQIVRYLKKCLDI